MDLKAALGLEASPDVENTVHYELYRDDGGQTHASYSFLFIAEN